MNTQDFRAGMDKDNTGSSQTNTNSQENVEEKGWNNVLPPETEKPLMTDYSIFKAGSDDFQEHPVFTADQEKEVMEKSEEKDNS
ncbi:hypothetical protein [Solitalea canadensis]|uniref:Uncharacterized protein n=1 Tax=Solitalea canadensis (strain ATCC 29591 / DSM 3403 / JCM 21819 / LMG 8368 / NBRC 15130 / NCIMB 12057 / USAM 9D) TaxID=929556 RepID=H8KQH9_SOLCM|nr:hypothetical protein [Solitalea canadensis]AFD06595.1 hypothetical protein Solca_1522 [Solitalea canadensis DSM 3403]